MAQPKLDHYNPTLREQEQRDRLARLERRMVPQLAPAPAPESESESESESEAEAEPEPEPEPVQAPIRPLPVKMLVKPTGGKMGYGQCKRHKRRRVLRDNIKGITKPAIRRLARRGGVKRISGLCYDETRGQLKDFLERVIRKAVVYKDYAGRKTVTAFDVVMALKSGGTTLYGFESQ